MFAVVVVSVAALVISIAAAGYAYGVQISAQSKPSRNNTASTSILQAPESATRLWWSADMSCPVLSWSHPTVITDIAAFNETIAGAPHDIFSPTFIHVNQGDTVIIHFINTEETQERHTLTLGAYNIDVDLAHGEKQDIKFVASQAGIFQFYCRYHLPTMVGQLVVLPAGM